MNIVQLIPAPDWYAAFEGIETPVAAWALLASGEVVGLVPEGRDGLISAEFAGFKGYEKKRSRVSLDGTLEVSDGGTFLPS